MFSLNRFAKHAECERDLREDIYALKNRLVEILYREGLCTAAWQHRMELPAKECWDCYGHGCYRCDGTGVYAPAKVVWFGCFRFEVEGKTYVWHQPMELVKFAVQYTEAPADWQPGEKEKPVPLKKRALVHARELVRWVVEQSGFTAEGAEGAEARTGAAA